MLNELETLVYTALVISQYILRKPWHLVKKLFQFRMKYHSKLIMSFKNNIWNYFCLSEIEENTTLLYEKPVPDYEMCLLPWDLLLFSYEVLQNNKIPLNNTTALHSINWEFREFKVSELFLGYCSDGYIKIYGV